MRKVTCDIFPMRNADAVDLSIFTTMQSAMNYHSRRGRLMGKLFQCLLFTRLMIIVEWGLVNIIGKMTRMF